MRDHTKRRAFELADEMAVLIYWTSEPDISECDLKLVEPEKVLGALLQSMRKVYSLQPKQPEQLRSI